ncbi:AfsA-related hotdog domain-containing protein [Micromonospora maritima]|uniref:AfsA-related hotdog domain-containing protein n=1 Tax=Micromonospora maritima TaxID=986711 RepID=UPI00378AE4D7
MTIDFATPTVGLDFAQTVHKKLVHKHAIDEAFVTGWECRDDSVLLTAVLPRAHTLYCEFPVEDRLPDIALITEVCRQSCFVVAHTKFDVPVVNNRYQFLLQNIETSLFDLDKLPPARPVELLVECTIEETRRRGQELSALVWRFRVTDPTRQVHVADVLMRMTWIDRGDWRRMRNSMRRGRGLPEQIDSPALAEGRVTPEQVGRRNIDNVVLQDIVADGAGYRAQARVDRRHPVLFDHPIDHVYAMVQLETCRQLSLFVQSRHDGVAASEVEVSGFAVRFESVAELDLPLTLAHQGPVTGPDGRLTHPIRLEQGGRLVSEFTLTTQPRRAYLTPALGA